MQIEKHICTTRICMYVVGKLVALEEYKYGYMIYEF